MCVCVFGFNFEPWHAPAHGYLMQEAINLTAGQCKALLLQELFRLGRLVVSCPQSILTETQCNMVLQKILANWLQKLSSATWCFAIECMSWCTSDSANRDKSWPEATLHPLGNIRNKHRQCSKMKFLPKCSFVWKWDTPVVYHPTCPS